MVTQNPDLEGLQLDNFHKAARQLNKLTNELQDVVMSIRMVPLSMTFQKMNRIVRDMGKKLNKSIELEIIGEETEVDKNIIERISDPLIHLIRNAVDHGLEDAEERVAKGKPPAGKITLEAKNAGGDVWIFVKDDGRGLNREKILKKARVAGLIHKPENELTDKEIYSFIFTPGFSTKDNVTEFSGRGVGMDIVSNNISMVGGTIFVDSVPDNGTIISIKLPLTLAIINGMSIKVGKSRYTIPTISIKESFKVKNEAIITDSEGNEMIMVRGEVYPIVRLHRFYKIDTAVTDINDGIIVMVENDSKVICIFADELLGEQQVVVKALPKYIKKVKGIGGCTLLGDGSISLILDIAGLVDIN
ncbi:signal transduction histidine kinase CheA [Acetivibrio straminisolvens JCM 21531]|uniref:histidine kinase n=2 Tax=Acetivibrio straminisolvens TaxID=253314 RepID=W4V2I3_9FIRM|nr:signal transduction histidine kinase CheA [Acetivibrio straminisolvens JCM 21531]